MLVHSMIDVFSMFGDDTDYEALCSFLIALNEKDDSHINWNWARLEWMIEHPEFDKNLILKLTNTHGQARGVAVAIP